MRPSFSTPLPNLHVVTPNVSQPPDLRALVEQHGDFLWRSLRRLGVGENQADDALQQVFITAARNLARIELGKERSFLFGIAMNIAAHERRSRARSREVAFDDALDPADPSAGADEELDRMRARELLDEVLDDLPLELRTIFVLFELEEVSMAEIAELVAIPMGTVASRLRRAREHFHRSAQRVKARHLRIGGTS